MKAADKKEHMPSFLSTDTTSPQPHAIVTDWSKFKASNENSVPLPYKPEESHETEQSTVNIHATDGMAEDLIRSMIQTAAYELHLKTLLEKRTSEMENGLIDVDDEAVLKKQFESIESTEESLIQAADMRREDMLLLYELYGAKGDKERWCTVKHTAMMMITAFEAWQASDNSKEIQQNYLNKNKVFIKELAAFLGVEITQCAACFADLLKSKMK